jgi:hypothetical protein
MGFIMKEINHPTKNLLLKEIISKNNNLTFLVGTGCSVDPPTCLPTRKEMMKESYLE